MAGRLNEEQAAVNPGILDVALTLGSEFLAEVGRVLILDVLDNGVPARIRINSTSFSACSKEDFVPSVVVDLVTVARRVNDVQTKTDSIFLDDYSKN